MFHVFIIGSASNHSSPGQLPTAENIVKFYEEIKMPYYIYCIDPNHKNNHKDMEKFVMYENANIPFAILPESFAFEKFQKEYKILKEDQALLVDFANLAESEYDFMKKLGNDKNLFYSTPGCAGKQLDILPTYNKAKSIPKYTIESSVPVPENLSTTYRQSLKVELGDIIALARLLPNPPPWMKEKYNHIKEADNETLLAIRDSSFDILKNFFQLNNQNINNVDSKEWYQSIKTIMKLV